MTKMRSLGACLLALVVSCGGSTDDEPLTVTFRGIEYDVSCAGVNEQRLGDSLQVRYEPAEKFPAGDFGVEARSIAGVPVSQAIALEFEEDLCQRGNPYWMLALRRGIRHERALEIGELIRRPPTDAGGT